MIEVKYRKNTETSFNCRTFYSSVDKNDGKTLDEFIVWLVKKTPVVEIKFGEQVVWSYSQHAIVDDNKALINSMFARANINHNNNIATHELKEASVYIVIDYNVSGDWLDEECKKCAVINNKHTQECFDMSWA